MAKKASASRARRPAATPPPDFGDTSIRLEVSRSQGDRGIAYRAGLARVLAGYLSCQQLQLLFFLLFAFMKPFPDRRASWYLRSLIGQPLREIGMIMLHDIERRFHGEIAMVFRK
jgi:hypothetical protein